MNYLSEAQITKMAESALISYEMSCSWERAFEDAAEYSLDEFGIRPRKSAVLLAVKKAKVAWGEIALDVRRAVS